MRLFLVRHGGTRSTEERRFAGGRDLPLSPEGQGRAEALARALEGEAIAAVYASPLERARATAEIVAKPHRLEVRVEPDLRDMSFGEWEGRTREEVAARAPEAWAAWRERPAAVRPAGGETLGEVDARVAAFLARALPAHPDGTVVAIGHAIPVRLVVLAALGLPPDRLWAVDASPAGLTELEYAHDWITVHRLNTLAHLGPLTSPSALPGGAA